MALVLALVLKLSESNFEGVQCRVSPGNPCIPGISLCRRVNFSHMLGCKSRTAATWRGFNAGQVARQELNTSGTCVEVPWNWQPLSLEGVSQMVYILPERLLTLVRPAFDLVLRRIRSLKALRAGVWLQNRDP